MTTMNNPTFLNENNNILLYILYIPVCKSVIFYYLKTITDRNSLM